MAALTELERAIESIVTVFVTFAFGQEGAAVRGCSIHFRPSGTIPTNEKIAILDWNNDEELAFGEYWRLIRELARAMRRDKAAK
uniref:Uncharacterized protein n=1 Tax=Malurus cyaneus samueli TaxID=2593467 RepID=A0A8C5X6I8_9PASS